MTGQGTAITDQKADLLSLMMGAERDARAAIRRARRDIGMASLTCCVFLGEHSAEARELHSVGTRLRKADEALNGKEAVYEADLADLPDLTQRIVEGGQSMSEQNAVYSVAPGIGPDAVAIVPPTEALPIWVTVDAERWYRELTALREEILAWRDSRSEFGEPTPYQIGLLQRAWQLADAAAIAAVRPDLVLQDRTLKYLREEFAALAGRVATE